MHWCQVWRAVGTEDKYLITFLIQAWWVGLSERLNDHFVYQGESGEMLRRLE